jgi:hypothetical protein
MLALLQQSVCAIELIGTSFFAGSAELTLAAQDPRRSLANDRRGPAVDRVVRTGAVCVAARGEAGSETDGTGPKLSSAPLDSSQTTTQCSPKLMQSAPPPW